MRRGFTLFIGLALVATACAPQDMTEETSTTSTTTTVTATTETTTTSPDEEPTIPEGKSPTAANGTLWAYQEWSVPPEFEPYSAAWGDPGMVVLGYRALHLDDSPTPNGLWFSDGSSWTETLIQDATVADEYGLNPEVTNLVWFGGRYLAFLMGDSTTTPGRASLLASDDGRTWNLEYLGSAPAAALPAGLYATPESPPWPGTSAVTRVAVHGDEITAAGWTVLHTGSDFLSVPVIWRSTDGLSWSTKALPNANFNNEWASDVAVGPLGYLVEVAGPVHQSAYLWYSPNGEDWTYVGDRFDDQWRALIAIAVGEESLVAVLMNLEDNEAQTLGLWRSTNGIDWEEVESPFSLRALFEGYPLADLANTGQGIVTIISGEETTELWRSLDGLSWTQLPPIVIPSADPLVPVFPDLAIPFSAGGRLSLSAAVPGKVSRWSEATETRSVVRVAPDDVLNVRSGPGVENEIIANLSPTATGVMLTGRETLVGSSVWVEIATEQGTGWVNEYYLAELD